jgi:hypothetical protein
MTKIRTTNGGQVEIGGLPNKCPFCHKSITPHLELAHHAQGLIELIMWCPDADCRQSFVGYYSHNPGTRQYEFIGKTTSGNIVNKEFSQTITTISPSFTTIYNQAFFAEQNELSEICGVGYRKALEFLIKDYSLINHPNDKAKIEEILLGKCIEKYVTDERVKSVAKRAAWLGNDETHYIRKWEGKNLDDLKKLIDLTIHWIEMESLTKSFEIEMPE